MNPDKRWRDVIVLFWNALLIVFDNKIGAQVNRVGVVNAVYEARAIPGDHKQKEEDGGVSSFGGGGGPAFWEFFLKISFLWVKSLVEGCDIITGDFRGDGCETEKE